MSIGSLLRKLEFCFLICALSTTAAYAQFSVLYTYGSAEDPKESSRSDSDLYQVKNPRKASRKNQEEQRRSHFSLLLLTVMRS